MLHLNDVRIELGTERGNRPLSPGDAKFGGPQRAAAKKSTSADRARAPPTWRARRQQAHFAASSQILIDCVLRPEMQDDQLVTVRERAREAANDTRAAVSRRPGGCKRRYQEDPSQGLHSSRSRSKAHQLRAELRSRVRRS